MTLTACLDVPKSNGTTEIKFHEGHSVVFIGANGSGKTRLGVFIDKTLSGQNVEVHRIAAHRSLVLNPEVVPPSLDVATKRLLYGYDQGDSNWKHGHRWQNKPETALLNDFDHLLSALYAENNDISVAYRQSQINALSPDPPPKAKLDRLKEIWEVILPHRQLVVLAGNIKTKPGDHPASEYSASDMSDGERVIFYLIGQSLLAPPSTVLIFDEPELHINKSVLSRLWDAIESARPDCAFVYITHDVEFASSRHAATRYAIRSYQKEPHEIWDVEVVPDNANIPVDVVTTILGSRRHVLFVEGNGDSLDSSLYRRVYEDFTVIAVGSCDNVIHTVTSFINRLELHHVGCAGLVDADGRIDAETDQLEQKGIYCLPVSEVENLLLLPRVFLAIAKELKFPAENAKAKLDSLRNFVFDQAMQQIDKIGLRYTKRRIDAQMKKIGLSSKDISMLDDEFKGAASNIDTQKIFNKFKAELEAAITHQEYEKVLRFCDHKGWLSEVAKQLGYQHQKALEEFIGRALRSDQPSELHSALKDHLPKVVPRPKETFCKILA